MTLEHCLIISECFMLQRSGKRYVQRSCRCARREGSGRNGGIVPLVLNHGSRWGEYSYNSSQREALFLNFILVKNSTCFGQIYCPSSGVLITVFAAIGVCHTEILKMGKITGVYTCAV